MTIYDFDAQTDTFAKSIFNTDVTYPGFEHLVSEEVEVPGHDGAMIPLSIIHKQGIPLDGSNCCILDRLWRLRHQHAPPISASAIRWRPTGSVLAFAHVRGGSEKGEAWYKAGFKTTKPNTWKDFISCAEYLVKKGYTSPEKLAGTGTSAGGILISRAITERPDLFAAAVCNVGCANAMRMEFTPNGPGNTPEFGTVKDPVECQALYEMDGVQHVVKGVKYPAVLGVGGWNDPRVALGAGQVRGGDAGREHLGQARADEGELRRRPLHGGKNRHLQELCGPGRLPALAGRRQGVSAGQPLTVSA